MTSLFLFISAVASMVCAGAVVWQSRMIVRLIRENGMLVESINALFIEAVWPPHKTGES